MKSDAHVVAVFAGEVKSTPLGIDGWSSVVVNACSDSVSHRKVMTDVQLVALLLEVSGLVVDEDRVHGGTLKVEHHLGQVVSLSYCLELGHTRDRSVGEVCGIKC